MKTYLLIAGYQYYPDRGTDNWIVCYNSEEEATKAMNDIKDSYEWFDIVDLKEWMNMTKEELKNFKESSKEIEVAPGVFWLGGTLYENRNKPKGPPPLKWKKRDT